MKSSYRGADRVNIIRSGETKGNGPIVYWMNRDMRFEDNWAMLYALDWARDEGRPLVVAYNLVPTYLGGGGRQCWFKLAALEELHVQARERGIPFALFAGDRATQELAEAFQSWHVAGWVTDQCPLRGAREWRKKLDAVLRVPCVEVDAHNIVPVWVTSNKQEFGAHTIRPKLQKHLKTYLTDIPSFRMDGMSAFTVPHPSFSEWKKRWTKPTDALSWIVPGPQASKRAIRAFVENGLRGYEERNDPTKDAQSNISPWLHYGNLSAQRVAWMVRESGATPLQKESFLEELIIRRELADNFCFYQSHYDSLRGAPAWAIVSLDKHRRDKREYLYTHEEFEQAQTHDELWNAAQRQLLQIGKMHGYMRMYWAKKMLEWTPDPETAVEIGVALNDRYELDGRDPNGYVGVLWSVAGLHDRPWGERPVFGMVRYMNRAGCERKFDVGMYIDMWHD